MASSVDIVIDQNSNFKMTVEWRNPDNTGISLTNYTFLFMIKDKPGGTTLANLSSYVTKDAVVAGRILVNVPFSITQNLNFDQGVYDIVAVNSSPSERTRVVKGRVLLDRAISV